MFARGITLLMFIAQAAIGAEPAANWSGTFHHPNQALNPEQEIEVTKVGDTIKLKGFYESFTFRKQQDGSYRDAAIGSIDVKEVQVLGLEPIVILGYAFTYQAGYLTGRISERWEHVELCELEVQTSVSVTTQSLNPGTARLSGGYRPRIDRVDRTLLGADFVQVPWKSSPYYTVKITRPGYLYAMKLYDEASRRSELEWENVGPLVTGAYQKDRLLRTWVEAGQVVHMSGYELSLIAGQIVKGTQ